MAENNNDMDLDTSNVLMKIHYGDPPEPYTEWSEVPVSVFDQLRKKDSKPGEKVIDITDGIGEKHTLFLSVYHTNESRVSASMIFDHGKGGHYVFGEREIKEMLHLIIDEMM